MDAFLVWLAENPAYFFTVLVLLGSAVFYFLYRLQRVAIRTREHGQDSDCDCVNTELDLVIDLVSKTSSERSGRTKTR